MYKSLIKCLFARLHHPGRAWRCPEGGGGKGGGGELPAAWDSYLFALNRATDLPLGFAFTQVHPVHLLTLLFINRIVSRFTPQLLGKVCTWVAPEDRKYLIISHTHLAHLPRCAVLQIINQVTSQREVQAHPGCGLRLYSSTEYTRVGYPCR